MMTVTMTTTEKPPHSKWIENKYIEWRQKQTTRKATIEQFAKFVGVSRSDYNNYTLRKTRPKGEDLERIGEMLGPEIYDLLGLERPDPWVKRMEKLFDGLSPESREKAEAFIRKLAGEAAQDKAEKADKLKTSKGKA